MKKHLTLTVFSICLFGMSCQEAANHEPEPIPPPPEPIEDTIPTTSADTVVETHTVDTLFISRGYTRGNYHAIYIDKDRNAERRGWLTNFTFDSRDSAALKGNADYRKENKSPFKRRTHDLNGLAQHWLPLYEYKDSFYLYAPSDWGNAGRRIISDSSVIYWYMDGPYDEPIIAFSEQDENTRHLLLYAPFENHPKKRLMIHTVDPETQMAVWEYLDDNSRWRYRLMVPKEKAYHFDMIVNYSPNTKQHEFDFDTIDFSRWFPQK